MKSAWLIVFGILIVGGLAIPVSHAASGPEYGMSAYIAGNPDKVPAGPAYSGFGFAYPYANFTSVLPQFVSMYVQSRGNSTIQVSNGNAILLSASFGNHSGGSYVSDVFNTTLPTGSYDLIVTISSSVIGKSRTEIFSIQVVTLTQYINYANAKKGIVIVTNPLPPWEEILVGGLILGITIVLTVKPIRGFYRAWKRKQGLPMEDDPFEKETERMK